MHNRHVKSVDIFYVLKLVSDSTILNAAVYTNRVTGGIYFFKPSSILFKFSEPVLIKKMIWEIEE